MIAAILAWPGRNVFFKFFYFQLNSFNLFHFDYFFKSKFSRAKSQPIMPEVLMIWMCAVVVKCYSKSARVP